MFGTGFSELRKFTLPGVSDSQLVGEDERVSGQQPQEAVQSALKGPRKASSSSQIPLFVFITIARILHYLRINTPHTAHIWGNLTSRAHQFDPKRRMPLFLSPQVYPDGTEYCNIFPSRPSSNSPPLSKPAQIHPLHAPKKVRLF